MTHTYNLQGMTCGGCAATIKKALATVENVQEVKVALELSTVEISMDQQVPLSKLQVALAQYPYYRIFEATNQPPAIQQSGMWADFRIWKRAGLNTLNCLIGCSIGDFLMIIFLQYFYPGTSMAIQMVLATAAGLMTSVAMETVMLRAREKFQLALAFKTAISMSFLSMIAMELVMNFTDFMITGGKAAFGNPLYWTALLVAMVAGFLAPLPYNYYRLKKFNLACH